MVPQEPVLVMLVKLVDRIPEPPSAPRRGRRRRYSDRLFLKALVVMVIRRLPRVHTLLEVLAQPELRPVRELLTEDGRFPSRRTWERRLRALPEGLPARIGCLGRCLVERLDPWRDGGRAAAVDSTALRALGGVWHKQHREAGLVPHTSIDTEAGWTRSGWHGWVYGWKLHLVSTVAAAWIPLAAELTAANAADNEVAPRLLPELPPELRFLLGDTGYADPDLRERVAADGRELVTGRRGRYRIPTAGSRSAGSSTRCAPRRSRTSTANSRPSSTAVGRSRPAGWRPPAATSSARSSSTSSPCCTATSAALTSASASSPSSRPPEDL